MGKIYYIIVAFAALLFTACQEEDFGSGAKGGIRISLAEEIGMDVSTRSTPKELGKPLASNFKFRITDSEGHEKDYNYTDDVIPLSAGKYEVAAYCGNPAITIALDAPYYEGTAEATVEEGKTTKITLACKVANALLSIRINEDDKEKFNAAFPEAYFKLSLESGDNKASSDTTQSFYFPAGSTISKLAFSKDGSDYQDLGITNWPKEIKEADHIIVTVGIEPAPSGVSLTVKKLEVHEETIEETIPLEWLPKPSVSATGFDSNNSLTFAETETKEAKLDLKLASALQDIKFKFNFKDEQFSSLTKEEYLWSNEEDKKVISEQLSINVSDKSVDLNGLLAKLQTNAGATTTNTIEVDVKANNRWSSEDKEANRTYTITCNKPVFHVDAYPGNIWTKEFTMNALREEQVESGDFAKITRNIKYQYSTDGENNWTDLSDDLRKDQLEPGTTYYIRGLYRDEVPGEVTEVKTYPEITLVNGGLENAQVLDGSDSGISRGTVYGWDGWATLNNISTPSGATCYSFNSRSGCRPTSDAHNGNAVRVITLGYGIGGWAKPTSAMHSKLYLGVSADKDGNGVVNGIEYNSRPSHLKFWYKCVSNRGNDESLIQIQLLHDDIILGEGQFTTGAKDSYAEKSIEIDYTKYDLNKTLNPNKLIVLFQSGVKESLNIDSDLKSFISSWNTVDRTADATYRGNELFIDEVSLVYDK